MKIDIFNAEEKYDILYTDPPWQQGRGGKKAARPNSTGTTVPYETMDVHSAAYGLLLWNWTGIFPAKAVISEI